MHRATGTVVRPAAPVCTLDEADAVAEATSFAALKGVFISDGRATTDGIEVSLACALDSEPIEVLDGPEVVEAAAVASDADAEAKVGAESVEGAEVVISLSALLVVN
jgi:hypothetical protein